MVLHCENGYGDILWWKSSPGSIVALFGEVGLFLTYF